MLDKLITKKNMKVEAFIGIGTFLCLFFISVAVFCLFDGLNVLVISSAFETAIGAFTGSHGYVLEMLIEHVNDSIGYLILLIIYSTASLAAVVFSVLLIADLLQMFYFKSKEGTVGFNENTVLIFGFNKTAITMIENTDVSSIANIKEKKNIHIVSLDSFSDEQINEIASLGISYDCFSLDKLTDTLNRKKFSKVKCVLLSETKGMNNYFLYKKIADSSLIKNKDLRISCIPASDAEQLAIENDGSYLVNMIGLKQVVAQSVAKTVGDILCGKGNIVKYKSKEIKCLMIGFGETGQNVFRVLVNQLTVDSNNKITIDIVDKDARQVFRKAMQNVSGEYKDDEGLHIESPVADGILDVNIYNYAYSDVRCTDMMEKNDYDFVVLNILNSYKYVDFVENSRQLIEYKNNTQFVIPIYLKDEYSINLGNSNKLNNLHISKVYDFYNLNLLNTNDVEEDAIEFNYRYKKIEGSAKNDKYSMWKDAGTFNRKSSMFQSLHQNINDSLRMLNKGQCTAECEKLKGETDSDEIEKIINANAMLREIAITEHRRWTYFMILDGWKSNPTKNKKLKHSDCIMNWDLLCKEKKDVLIYDLTPLFILVQNDD